MAGSASSSAMSWMSMLTVMLILWLLAIMVKMEVAGINVTLGMMSPFTHVRLGWVNNAAAATMAVARAEKEGLLTGISVHIHWEDDTCSSLGGTGKAVLLKYNYSVDAYIGPPCSAATLTAGLLASYWNLAMVSPASSDPILADKNQYRTLVRLGLPFNRMGSAFVKMFRHFGWNRVVIATRRKTDNRDVFCDYSSRATADTFQENKINVAFFIQIPDLPSDDQIDGILTRLRQDGRSMLKEGRYIIFMPDHLPPHDIHTPWAIGDEDDDIVKEAYRHVFQVTVSQMAGERVEQFRDEVAWNMAEPPWNYNATLLAGERGSIYSPFLHDAVYLYLLLLNETLTENLDYRDGQLMFRKATNRTFFGETGQVRLDEEGDRLPDYWLWKMAKGKDVFEDVLEVRAIDQHTQEVIATRDIEWLTEDGSIPVDEPICGFYSERCPPDDSVTKIIIVVAIVVVIVIIVGLVFWYRRWRLERELEQMLWKAEYSDICFTKRLVTRSGSVMSQISEMSRPNLYPFGSGSIPCSPVKDSKVFSVVAVYKGAIVAVKYLPSSRLTIGRAEKLHFKAMRELRHDNVLSFVGLCLDSRCPVVLSAYCAKGSLEDIIENEDITLDWTFKMSLILDLVSGMKYLHDSPIFHHGRLKSSNCLVDNRWTLKISDFGLHFLRGGRCQCLHTEQCVQCKGLLWTAPEVLRQRDSGLALMDRTSWQKADVYSFAVVLYELTYRAYPYDTSTATPAEVVKRVENVETPPYRPVQPTGRSGPGQIGGGREGAIVNVMQACWSEDPAQRPSFPGIKALVVALNTGRSSGIVDSMLMKLEKYANNLEDLVEQRTKQLSEERKKSDMLLFSMLPRTVVDKLKAGDRVQAELFDEVTVYFSDIVSFTELASFLSPMDVVDLLNDLYTKFDSILCSHDVYKVETIGDAYMVVSGAPQRNEDRHAGEIANMAIDFVDSISCYKIKQQPDKQLRVRIGIHTGPCAAGVVGLTMPRYCLFGDTVNMAARMESTGQPMKIQVSQRTKEILVRTGRYLVTYRDTIEVKGKGPQKTYWLDGTVDRTIDDTGQIEC